MVLAFVMMMVKHNCTEYELGRGKPYLNHSHTHTHTSYVLIIHSLLRTFGHSLVLYPPCTIVVSHCEEKDPQQMHLSKCTQRQKQHYILHTHIHATWMT